MPEANPLAVQAFDKIMKIVQIWEDGAITDEEMHQKIDFCIYEYRHLNKVTE